MQIDVLSANKVDVMRTNTTFFTSSDIAEDRVVYRHDDSESRRDTFHFVATSDYSYSSSRGSDFQYLAVFHIHVILRNDQTPTRVVDKVFHVVEGGQKLLTGDDLRFVDLDIDTKTEDIRYNHHAIPNGELVLVENPTQPVFQFTQRDLDEERILFRHLGANFGRIMLWVSDGQYFVSTELKVRASTPFVRVANNSGIIVQRGESGFLTVANLSIETNLNARGKGIRFKVGLQ
jgi:chondroitin sulfate proteoglycan 4